MHDGIGGSRLTPENRGRALPGRILDLFLSLLYPPSCPLCAAELLEGYRPSFCRVCLSGFEVAARGCSICGEPPSRPVRARCASARPPFRIARSCFVYRGDASLARAIARWKYGGDEILGDALARLFRTRTPPEIACYDLIVPVPLHPARLAERGFNQAAVLARALPATRGRVSHGVLSRSRGPFAQAALGRRQRLENVAGRFQGRDERTVQGRTALLVDDVMTSGATAAACARALLDLGASHVDVLTLARTPASHGAPHAPEAKGRS